MKADRLGIVMVGVVEHCEGYPVHVLTAEESEQYADGQPHGECVCALNEGGHNGVAIDIKSLATWIKIHRPELLK